MANFNTLIVNNISGWDSFWRAAQQPSEAGCICQI